MWSIHNTFSKCETNPYHKNSTLCHLVVQLAQASSLFCSIFRSHLFSCSCLCFPLPFSNCYIVLAGPGPGLTRDWHPNELFFGKFPMSQITNDAVFVLSINHSHRFSSSHEHAFHPVPVMKITSLNPAC